jgi:hypothetical protein
VPGNFIARGHRGREHIRADLLKGSGFSSMFSGSAWLAQHCGRAVISNFRATFSGLVSGKG